MDMQRYMDVLRRRKWVVLFTLIATVGIVAAGTALMAPVFSASAMVRIAEVRTAPATYSDATYSQQLQNTYIQLLQSRPSLETVIQQLKLGVKPEALQANVKVEGIPASELIKVTATRGDPKQAADVANALAELATRNMPPSYSITVAVLATPPDAPARPQPALYVTLAAVLGLIGGLGLAFLFENMDRTIHSTEDLERAAGVPMLGWIPRFGKPKQKVRGKVTLLDGSGGAAVEAFRLLSANVLARAAAQSRDRRTQPATFLITSPEAGTGKSTVLVNLAATMARVGQRVIVVGTKLLHPDLPLALGVPERLAMGAVSRAPGNAGAALVDTRIPHVRLLSSSAPSSGIGLPPSVWLRELVETLADDADVVLLDSPAILASADAALLAPLVDGILIVAASDLTTDQDLELARAQLEAVGGSVLGVVFNKADARAGRYRRPGSASGQGPSISRHPDWIGKSVLDARGIRTEETVWDVAGNHDGRFERAG